MCERDAQKRIDDSEHIERAMSIRVKTAQLAVFQSSAMTGTLVVAGFATTARWIRVRR
jgi:hypothetical protein